MRWNFSYTIITIGMLFLLSLTNCQQLKEPQYASSQSISNLQSQLDEGYSNNSNWTSNYSTIINKLVGEELYSKTQTVTVTMLNIGEVASKLSVEVHCSDLFDDTDKDIAYRFDLFFDRTAQRWRISNQPIDIEY